MTIKQVLIGTLVGSSIVGIMVHRMLKERAGQARVPVIATSKVTLPAAQPRKATSLKKSHRSKRHTASSETELSSGKLY